MDVQIECVCPPKADGQTRHPDGDTVTLRERLDFRGASAARWAAAIYRETTPGATTAQILATLSEQFVIGGIEGWTLVDSRGKAVPVNETTIRDLMENHVHEALVIADVADGLYSEAAVSPLAQKASKSSPPMQTADSTSHGRQPVAIGNSGSTSPTSTPKPSRRSSTTTSPTDATGPTTASLAGASNS